MSFRIDFMTKSNDAFVCLYISRRRRRRHVYRIAIYGESFCWSAERALKILSSNALRVIAINSVGDFVLFLGKASVVTSVVFIGIELIKV